MEETKKKTRSGSGLIFAVILLFVILGMVVTLSSITVLETKMSQKTKSSVGAFYNSESGVEWALNKIANAAGDNISDAFPGFAGGQYDCPSGFECDVYFLDDQGNVIASDDTIDKIKAVRSVGTQTAGDSTQRAIEAAVAAGGGGCYVSFKTSCTGDACCITGFTNKGSAGSWGICNGSGNCTSLSSATWYLPPGGTCYTGAAACIQDEAHVCCQ